MSEPNPPTATVRAAKPKREIIRIPVFTGKQLAPAVRDHDPRVMPPIVVDDNTWLNWFGPNSKNP